MKIHEYQAKQLLRAHGVPVPNGELARSAAEARAIADRLGGGKTVVKAQIHAGGRGKGGGVKLAQNAGEAETIAAAILGMTLVTHQTGPAGRLVRAVLIEQGLAIDRELYLGMVLDRQTRRMVVIGSREGGVEIEELARTRPEAIARETVDPLLGLRPFQARRMAFALGLEEQLAAATKLILSLANLVRELDATMAEINPLVVTEDGALLALDCKIDLDDNALYRHPDLAALRDLDEEDPLEVEASRHGLNYIKLDGEVGCMVNGAGLAMATMDLIKQAGSAPANFLDVGGGANVERIASAFRILTSDPDVRAVLVNIFGGIVRCDRVAEGIIEALKTVKANVPIIVRLEGTNAIEARELLAGSSHDFQVAASFAEAARLTVASLHSR